MNYRIFNLFRTISNLKMTIKQSYICQKLILLFREKLYLLNYLSRSSSTIDELIYSRFFQYL